MDVDEVLAIQLHKQLNAIPLRRREKRGQDAVAQQSLERLKREKQGKPRSKRTNSSSQEHPSSRKRRVSDPDDDHGHTSSHQRMKREPTDSNQSPPGYDDQHYAPQSRPRLEHRIKPCDSRDSGMHREQQRHPAEDLRKYTPGQAAAVLAARATRQQLKPLPNGGGPSCVKVFYAGVRWGLSLQPSAVKSRQALAKALNDALVGEILSVGQGECLSAVFLDASGATQELGPSKWGDSKADAGRWKTLAKSAARIYVMGPECLHRTATGNISLL